MKIIAFNLNILEGSNYGLGARTCCFSPQIMVRYASLEHLESGTERQTLTVATVLSVLYFAILFSMCSSVSTSTLDNFRPVL